MLFRFHPWVYQTWLPYGICLPQVQRPESGAGLCHPAAMGRGTQEASRQQPSHLQDVILKVFHQGNKNISLWGDELNHCTDLPEITIPLPVKKGPGCGMQWD